MKEIVLENDRLRVVMLPELGGKITSMLLKEKNFELIPGIRQGRTDIPRDQDDFGPYAYGLDDAFPSVDMEEIEIEGRSFHYPSHGEVWSHKMQVMQVAKKSVAMRFQSACFGYFYEKEIQLLENTLRFQYRIVNRRMERFPAIWTWHGLVRYEKDMMILPAKGNGGFRNVLENKVCGELTEPVCKGKKWMAKYYVDGKVEEGVCAICYPSHGVKYSLAYDKEKLPYLGIWINAGSLDGEYNCALEPSTGFYDAVSIASRENCLPVLKKEEELQFYLNIILESMETEQQRF